ncbi:MAG: carboxylating nicotinate-nucleotide diphosphorylase [Chitinophagales bacterium]|nr:carboxylating nicotinate-nucleotide diphosphorylase [Chitinophagales bacterium]
MYSIDKELLHQFIVDALYEDVHEGDHTSLACIPADARSKARLLVKGEGVIAGIAFAEAVFKHLDPTVTLDIRIKDGEDVKYGDEPFYIECNAQALLTGERLVLNTMQRLSGVATLASRFAFEVEGLPVKILDTRKTTPLMRFLEKWAVKVGGCENYRTGLYDWIMIKDNHVDASGSINQAIKKVHEYLDRNNLDLGITIEVRNLVELQEVLDIGGVTRIMLDNFEIPIMAEAVAHINGRFETEASGGITLNTVRAIAETGVDFISVGALTHSAGTMDLSLKVIK